jgi:predicted metalloprotease
MDAIVYDQDYLDGPVYDVGDYAVGLLLADAWSATMQRHLDDARTGIERSLQADCMTGAWTGDVLTSRDQNRHFYLSAGDLDEGLTALLRYGGADPARTGSVFDRIASYRKGLLQGISACDL